MKSTRKAWLGWMALTLFLSGNGFAQSPEFDADAGSIRINGGSPSSGAPAGYGYGASSVQYQTPYDPYGNPYPAYGSPQGYAPGLYDAYSPYGVQSYGNNYAPPPGATLDPAFRSAAGLGGPTYYDLEQARWALYRENLDRAGVNNGMTTFHVLQPFRVFGEYNIMAVNPRASVDDTGNGIFNFGLIHRLYVPQWDRTVGQSLWYDFDSSHLANYHRIGWQFETIGRYVNFRANVNKVLGQATRNIGRVFDNANVAFVGSGLVTNVTDIFETPYDEYSGEISGPVPAFGKYGVQWGLGLYFLAANEAEDTFGVAGRLQFQLTEDAWLQCYLTNDDVFDTNFGINLEFSLPNGRPSRIMRPLSPVMALTQSVLRDYRIKAKLGQRTGTISEINPCDNLPILVGHIDPNAAPGGNGTVENPFSSLAEFQASPNAANFHIIFVQPRTDGTDTNLNTGITIFDNQRLLGNGTTLDGNLLTFTSIRGTFDLPGQIAGERPILSNSAAAGTNVVTLAGNHVEVNNFTINATNTASGIVSAGAGIGGGIDGFNIRNNTFENFQTAINIVSDTSQPTLPSCTLENIGLIDFNQLNGDFGSGFGINITHVAGTGAQALNLRIADNTINDVLGEDVDGDGILDLINEDTNGNGILDPFEDTPPFDGNLDIFEDSNGNGILDLGDAILVTATGGTILMNDPNGTVNPAGISTGIYRNTIDNSGSGITVASDGPLTTIRVSATNNTVTNSTNPNIDPTALLLQGNAFEFVARNSAAMFVNSFANNSAGTLAQPDGLGNGVSFISTGLGSTMTIASLTPGASAVTSNQLVGNAGHGLQFLSDAQGVLNVTGVSLNNATQNGLTGIRFGAFGGGATTADLVFNNTANDNLGNGFGLIADDQLTGLPTTLTLTRFTGNTANGNGEDGLNILANGVNAFIDADIGRIVAGSTANNFNDNLNDGIQVTADGGARITGGIRNAIITGNGVSGGVVIDPLNPGSGIHLIARGTDPTNTFGSQIDFNDPIQQWDVAFNTITGNAIGVLADTAGLPPLVGTNLDLRLYASNIDDNFAPGFLLRGTENSTANVIIGDAANPRRTTFNNNVDAGIGVSLINNADADVSIVNVQVTNTTNGADTFFNGDGIAIRLQNSASIDGSITRSQIGGTLDGVDSGNAGDGVRVVNNGNSFPLFTEIFTFNVGGPLLADGNIITNNGANGVHFVRTGNGRTGVVSPVLIQNNLIDNNALDGVNLDSAGTFGPDPLTPFVDRFEVRDNLITNNQDDGAHFIVRADAQMNVLMDNNIINFNAVDGIHTSEQANNATDRRGLSGQWTRNEIFQNGRHGINLDATHATAIGTLLIGDFLNDALGNDIVDNGNDGITVTGNGGIDIFRNLISQNGQNTFGAGDNDAGIDVHSRTSLTMGIGFNDIINNRGDGIEIESDGPFNVNISVLNNFIAFNDGRGFDLLVQPQTANGSNLTQMIFNDNVVNENGEEGVYIVLTSSINQTQDLMNTGITTPALLADGNGQSNNTAEPLLRFDMNRNQILGNGGTTTSPQGTHGFDASGLVVRVGTTGFSGNAFDPDGVAPFIDGAGFVSDGASINSAFLNGGVIMRVANNVFGGNFGDDILFHSFTSTADPTPTAVGGTPGWSNAEFDLGNRYNGDPLARLDLHWGPNTYESNQVNNNNGVASANQTRVAFYDNADGVFKSRVGTATPAGPFGTFADRRRNAQRVAARIPNFLPPAGPPPGDQYLYPGLGPSTFRVRGNLATVLGDGFLLDNIPYDDTGDAAGLLMPGAVTGEMPYGWTYLGP